MLDTIREAWSWIGLEPAEVIATNSFGNMIIRAVDGRIWRICPEEWSCEEIAQRLEDFAKLSTDDGFRLDWEMSRLVDIAKQKLGPAPQGKCYCLKIPGVIGGKYEAANFGVISLRELISFSGDMANQIKDVPNGGKIKLTIVNKPSPK